MNNNIPWFILLCPLISAACILLFARKAGGLAALLSVFAVCASFVGSAVAFFTPFTTAPNEASWINLGGIFHVSLGVVVDPLSKVMLLVVTGVGALVHIYSLVYMEADDAKPRFFGGLSLFMFSMLGIVLADNFVMMFIFWELVGVSSYLLIGHWYRAAGRRRRGEQGFHLQSHRRLRLYAGYPARLERDWRHRFCGHPRKPPCAHGQSYLSHLRRPLYFLRGGRQISAISAARLVARRYGRSHAGLGADPCGHDGRGGRLYVGACFLHCGRSATALVLIAWIGIITAVLAALMATQQDDIKRILAYSTLSQLGYMVSAVGAGAPNAAMFHLFTHAFFKALLFLGAGAIIHMLHHEQNIWRMGGLRTRMPKTFWTFAVPRSR